MNIIKYVKKKVNMKSIHSDKLYITHTVSATLFLFSHYLSLHPTLPPSARPPSP